MVIFESIQKLQAKVEALKRGKQVEGENPLVRAKVDVLFEDATPN